MRKMSEEYVNYTEEEINEYVAHAKEYLWDLKKLMNKLDTEINDPNTYRRWVAVWIIRALGITADKAIGEVESVAILDKDKLL